MRRLKIQKRNDLGLDVAPDGKMFDEEDEYKEPDTWTIITAMNRVLELSEDSRPGTHKHSDCCACHYD